MEKLLAELKRCEMIAQSQWNAHFPTPVINMKLKGTVAGYCFGYRKIKLNKHLFEVNGDEFLETVAHEYAHAVKNWLQEQGRIGRERSHGHTWQEILRSFGYKAARCHNYSGVKKAHKYQMYEYSCGCQTHMITTIKHNRILNGKSYICKTCKGKLREVLKAAA